MTIKVACKCGKVINAPDKYEGKTAKCPACKEPIKIVATKSKKSTSPTEVVVEQEESKPKVKSAKKGLGKNKMGKLPRKDATGSDKKSKSVKSSKSDRRSKRVPKKGGASDAKKSKLPLVIIIAIVLIVGAGAAYYFFIMDNETPTQSEGDRNEKPKNENQLSDSEGTETSSIDSETSTAEGTAKFFINSIVNKKPGVAWDLLPSKYQEDIGKLKVAFTDNMDKVVYDKAFVIIGQITAILENKKELILAHPQMQNPNIPKDDLNDNWNNILSVFKIISESDLSSIDKMKNANVKDFANKTIGDLLGLADKLTELVPGKKGKLGFVEELKAMTIKVKGSTQDSTGVMAVGSNPTADSAGLLAVGSNLSENSAELIVMGSDSKENALPMVKIDGKWLPKEMTENWDKDIQSGIKKLEEIKSNPMASMQAIVVMGIVEGILTKFNSIETAEELDNLIKGAMGQLAPMMMPGKVQTEKVEKTEEMELIEF
jgi:hypothetical protein